MVTGREAVLSPTLTASVMFFFIILFFIFFQRGGLGAAVGLGGSGGGGKKIESNVINLLGGENSITSTYSAMQSVARGDVTGCQAESQACLHFKPNFQFSSSIFLHSH